MRLLTTLFLCLFPAVVQAADEPFTGKVVVLPDGRSLNQELVRAGYAWWYRKYAPADLELARLEGEASAAKKGLWAQPQPIAPWDWRNGAGLPAEHSGQVVGNTRSFVFHCPGCPAIPKMSPAN